MKRIYFLFVTSIITLALSSCNKAKKYTSTKKNVTVTASRKKTQKPIKKEVVTYPSYLTKNYVLGKFDYKTDTCFIKLPKPYCSKEIYLRKEVFNSFKKMADNAKLEGLIYTVISGTRNYTYQKHIWNYKWTTKFKNIPKEKRALKILEFSSMPSTSRHHWGTDLDINSLDNNYFKRAKGKKEYDWLIANAHKFGFYQVYTSKKSGRTGYNEEKWHWSYVPLSSIYLDYYNKNITNKDINGFAGENYTTDIGILKKYVNGINPKIINYLKTNKKGKNNSKSTLIK